MKDNTTASTREKLCKDCKHFESDGETERYAKCGAPQAYDITNRITGMHERTWNLCTIHRSAADERRWFKVVPPKGHCGEAGYWFEPKDES